MKKNVDIPGDAAGSQLAFARYQIKLGRALIDLEAGLDRLDGEVGEVVSVRFAAPGGSRAEWLAILTVQAESNRIVAFSSGSDFPSCLATLSARLKNGSLKWKEDQYDG